MAHTKYLVTWERPDGSSGSMERKSLMSVTGDLAWAMESGHIVRMTIAAVRKQEPCQPAGQLCQRHLAPLVPRCRNSAQLMELNIEIKLDSWCNGMRR